MDVATQNNAVILIPSGALRQRMQDPSGVDPALQGLHFVQPTPEQAQTVQQTIAKAQGFFSQYGLGQKQGNGTGLEVKFASNFPNAAYIKSMTGKEYMVIGTDPDTGKSFASDEDVIEHEYTHRVMDHVLGLRGGGETGAVNESLADTFAKAIQGGNDWIMGENVQPGGLRSMIDPSRMQDALHDQYGDIVRMPDNANDYVMTPTDNGGVHINMGIPNKAAALIGNSLGRQTMGDIYMGAVLNYMTPRSGIGGEARATLQSAASQFGATSSQTQAVSDAWKAVGINAQTGRIIPGTGTSGADDAATGATDAATGATSWARRAGW